MKKLALKELESLFAAIAAQQAVERTALYDDVASQLGGIRNFNYLI